ncbi:hypothetical protein OROMI_027168 [Orobanche minor]
MDSKTMTIINIMIFILFNIGYALVDESKATNESTLSASPPIYLHTPGAEDCYKNLYASDKTHIAKLLCEDNAVPVKGPASYDCCTRLWYINEKCYYNVLVEDLKKQYPCDKDHCDIRDRARQIWKYCWSLI